MYIQAHLSTSESRGLVSKIWGFEELVHNGSGYCGKLLHYNGKARSSLHRHLVKDEVLMVVKGVVLLEIINSEGIHEHTVLSEVRQDAIHLEPGVWHRLSPVGEALVFEWSSTHNDADVERLEESCLI